MKKKIKIKACATIANLSCGFDIIGLCVSDPYDIVEISIKEGKSNVTISEIQCIDDELSYDAKLNTAGKPILDMLNHIDELISVDLKIFKGIPTGSGMGSSSASAVAAVYGFNKLIGNKFNNNQLLDFAAEGEKVSAGVRHYDNIGPCLLGGTILLVDRNPLKYVKLNSPTFYCILIHPEIKIKTKDSRSVIPDSISLLDASKQWGYVGGLVHGLHTNSKELMATSMKDIIIEPNRSKLIPGFNEIKKTAIDLGAIGCSISGSGPSVFAFSDDMDLAKKIARNVKRIFKSHSIESKVFISEVNNSGPEVL